MHAFAEKYELRFVRDDYTPALDDILYYRHARQFMRNALVGEKLKMRACDIPITIVLDDRSDNGVWISVYSEHFEDIPYIRAEFIPLKRFKKNK